MSLIRDFYDLIFAGASLKTTGLLLGALLVLAHLFALFRPAATKQFLAGFPRNRMAGIVLTILVLVWSMVVVNHMDMAEFYTLRPWLLMILPIAAILVILYMDEFLAVRSLGTLMLLVSAPVLASAFLKEPSSRLLLPILAYWWIILGMIYVGMPWMLRNHIRWATAGRGRWTAICSAGVAYGGVMMLCATMWWGGF